MAFSQNMIRELRSLRVGVFHPDDATREELVRHIRRIGCTVIASWPVPDSRPEPIDVAFCLFSETEGGGPDWPDIPVIGLLEYESPLIVRGLLDANVHGIITKPIRPFGILSTIILARSLHRFGVRQKAKIEKLEETLRSRRLIDRAAEVLAASGHGTINECHQSIRRAAMGNRVSAGSVAEAIIAGKPVDGLKS